MNLTLKRLFFVASAIALANGAFGQMRGDTLRLPEVTVTSFRDEDQSKTTLSLKIIKVDSLSALGGHSLSEIMAREPGVYMLSTGPTISKPVVRGLYGNRVMVLLSGLRFDNQQWQEEHGLGLTDIGLDRIELIKGPMSVLYGSEALGGVINLIEEKSPGPGKRVTDAMVRFNSNTLGGTVSAAHRQDIGRSWFRVRIGADNHGDYTDGNNNRIVNSRADGYYFKGTFGHWGKKVSTTNNVLASYNRFGFIFPDIYTFITTDERWSRELGSRPAHMVLLVAANSDNKIKLGPRSELKINVGLQSNRRMENEGSGAISLNMQLTTGQLIARYEVELTPTQRLVAALLASVEDNTNFGSRRIVPNALMQEANLGLYHEVDFIKGLTLESGIGLGEKYIATRFTPPLHASGKEGAPFTKFAPYYNLHSGLCLHRSAMFTAKLNVATGVRIANLAELSSDGLHEGVFTYEIGDKNLANEKVVSVNASFSGDWKWVHYGLSPFYNRFNGYIYLAPTTEEWYGFKVYRYRQQNATQAGGEAFLAVGRIKGFEARLAYSGMISRTDDGIVTPYLPQHRFQPSIDWALVVSKSVSIGVRTASTHCLRQDQLFTNEVGAPAYWLWDASLWAEWQTERATVSATLAANNLLNAAYFDNLSRFKSMGLLNMGRNICLTVKFSLHG